MIVSGLEFCCHFSYCFHTVLYTLSSYIIFIGMLYKGMTITIFESCILKCMYWFYILISICSCIYMKLPHIHYPLIQNKFLTLQTGCMLTSFSVLHGGTHSLVWYTGIVLSLELTYNGARDLYASMEQQIQPLNFKSKLSLLSSLNNPVYYKSWTSKGPQTCSV